MMIFYEDIHKPSEIESASERNSVLPENATLTQKVHQKANQIFQKTRELYDAFVSHPFTKLAVEVVGEIAKFALGGYVVFWLGHFIFQIPLLSAFKPSSWSPVSLIMFCISSALGNGVIKVVSKIGLTILGERGRYGQLPLPNEGCASLRHRAWKVIETIEGLPGRVDKIFSEKVFHIRTEAYLRENDVQDYQLSNGEAIRRCFLTQFVASAKQEIPIILGMGLIQIAGLPVLFIPLQIYLQIAKFLEQVMTQFNEILDVRETMSCFEALPNNLELEDYCTEHKKCPQTMERMEKKEMHAFMNLEPELFNQDRFAKKSSFWSF